MAESLAGEDLQRLGAFAHNLKGTSATIGAGKASSLAKEIESRAKGGDSSGIQDLLQALDEEVQCVLALLSALPES